MASNLVLTAVGAAAIEAAYNAGEVVEITVAQIGDGGGAPVIADPATESLVNSFGSVPFSGGHNNDYMISGEVVIPAGDFPGNIIREVGLISRDGILIAYGAYPETWLPADETSVLKSVTIDFMMPIVHAESVVLVVDPDTAILTPTVADTLYLRQDKHLSEIADQGEAAQAEARKNLALGTAATLDATTSTTDSTPGHVLKVGDRGFGLGALPIIDGFDFSTYQFAAGETLLISLASSINKPSGIVSSSGWVYIHVTGVRNVFDDVSIITTDFNTVETTFCACVTESEGGARIWVTKKLPTSAADISAMPDTYIPPVISVNGMTGAVTIPEPDLSAYASSDWVYTYFVQMTRFGANLSTTWGSSGGTVPAGCALTGGDFNSENEYPIYAYMQYLINGAWVNASGGVGAASRVSASHYRAVPENGISSLINLRPYLRESNDPVDLPGVPHFIDDAGYDWFEAAPKLTGRVFIAVAPDTGVIVQIADSSLPDTDAFSLYPDGVSIYGLEALPRDCSIDGTWRFDSETLTAYQDADLAAARRLAENTRLRTQFATQAMLAISTLQNRVSIGRVRAGDADALAAWQNYLIDLDELTDAQLSAPDFVFPSAPQ